ncbi:hypothetical protein GOL38_33390, partial [Sinorhizobium medicae]|nr:hypothetical protein [Sinorhizobium medicae]MDX0581226.1 hypothetical protein [Sinorhizobium medicae]MDX0729636.1 hypothetical protein [Sinorhizobium medicae]MDX0784828.1 hypothetical protein [Sinorhizobium medicae]MDX1153446.1 hypothetical protein [Sinorhizobium medicae]
MCSAIALAHVRGDHRQERFYLTRAIFLELPPKDRTCSGLRLRADELARRLIS